MSKVEWAVVSEANEHLSCSYDAFVVKLLVKIRLGSLNLLNVVIFFINRLHKEKDVRLIFFVYHLNSVIYQPI